MTVHEPYWSSPPEATARRLGVDLDGLSTDQAAARLARLGANALVAPDRVTRGQVLWRQVRSPLVLLLVFAAAASALTGDWAEAAIVLAIVLASTWIGYRREYLAQTAVARLRQRIRIVATVVRDGKPVEVPVRALVPGDVVLLAAGSLVPADGIVIAATDCFVNEAVLTGESFPVEKRPGEVEPRAGVAARSNCVYVGSNVGC